MGTSIPKATLSNLDASLAVQGVQLSTNPQPSPCARSADKMEMRV